MTPEQWKALLRLLGPTEKEAGERYQDFRLRLIRLFEWRGCEFPEDMADETIDRVARRVAEGVELDRDPYAYFCGVAHHVYREVLRGDTRRRLLLEKGNWPTASNQEEETEDHRLDSLRHCMQLLDPEQRDLLLRYHQGENNIRARRELCKELGTGMNALRIRVHRLRRRLETCIEERLRD